MQKFWGAKSCVSARFCLWKSFLRGGGPVMDPLLSVTCTDDERRHDVADAASTFNGIDWVEVDPADQRILHVGFLHPLPGETGGVPASPALGPSNIVDRGRRTDPQHRRRVGDGGHRRADGHRRPRRRLLAVRPAHRAQPGRPQRPEELRPRAVGAPVLVQGQLPERPRLRATGPRRAPRQRRPDRRLPRQGLRRLPPADARPPRPTRAGLDGAQPGRSPRHRRRGARPHRRPHVVPPGRRRHRGVPRHGAQPHLGAPPRPPARLPRARGLHGAHLAAPRGDRQLAGRDRGSRRRRDPRRHRWGGARDHRRRPASRPARRRGRGVHAARPHRTAPRPQRGHDLHVGRGGVHAARRGDAGDPRQRRSARAGGRRLPAARAGAQPADGPRQRRRPDRPPRRAPRRGGTVGRPGGGQPRAARGHVGRRRRPPLRPGRHLRGPGWRRGQHRRVRGGPRQPRARPPRDDRTRRRPHRARPPAMAPGGQRGPDRLGAAVPARRAGRRAVAPGPAPVHADHRADRRVGGVAPAARPARLRPLRPGVRRRGGDRRARPPALR